MRSLAPTKISRRKFLIATALTLAARFTLIADELARLFRWCALGSALQRA